MISIFTIKTFYVLFSGKIHEPSARWSSMNDICLSVSILATVQNANLGGGKYLV